MADEKVLVIQPILAHYRESLFRELIKSERINFYILGGQGVFNVKTFPKNHQNVDDCLKNKFIRKGKHIFLWQQGIFKAIRKTNPTYIILTGVDIHIVSNLVVFIYYTYFSKKKIFWWGHGTHKKTSRLLSRVRKYFYTKASGVFSYSQKGKDNLIKIGVPFSKVTVLNNALNYSDYGYLKYDLVSEKPENKTIHLLYSGRMKNEKRVDLLIEALHLIKQQGILDFKCTIIGEGEDFEKNKILVTQLGLSNEVIFLGSVYGKAVDPYFLESDLLILPSNVGLSVIHGLSYGLPLITTEGDLHGPEIKVIEKGVNGDFYKKLSAKYLSKKIVEWSLIIKLDKKNIVQNCIQSVTQNDFLPDKVAIKMRDRILRE